MVVERNVVEGEWKGHCWAGSEPDSHPISIRLNTIYFRGSAMSKRLIPVTQMWCSTEQIKLNQNLPDIRLWILM